MNKYYLEFILSVKGASTDIIRNSLVEFGEDLKIAAEEGGDACVGPQETGIASGCGGEDAKSRDIKVCIYTEDPTIIFDTCSQFGRLKSVKIDERKG